jgi:hypothetical protein
LCAYRKTALDHALQSKEEAKRKPSPEELEQKVLQFLSAPLEAPPTKGAKLLSDKARSSFR